MPAHRRGEIREEAILRVAMSLLVEVGYDQLTIEAIAERARASKATIYRRWPGKAELVATAIRRYAGTPVAAPPDTTNLRDGLLAVLLELRTSLIGQDSALILGLLVAMRRDPDLAHTVRRHVLDHKRDVFAAVVAGAIARGEVPQTIDHALVAEISSAALLSRLLVTGEPLDDLFLQLLVDAVLLPMLNHQLDQR
ncbi:TetR/AcrR family transcriptional regulator [Microbispora triticiradicis]|nr:MULTISPECIES: TetR/AcrR family transcriptional regulator [Microbispora]GLW26937.1 putative HTH-type transcriptional regulator [Microbispora amethystogenes]